MGQISSRLIQGGFKSASDTGKLAQIILQQRFNRSTIFQFDKDLNYTEKQKKDFCDKLSKAFKDNKKSFQTHGLRFITPYTHKQITKIKQEHANISIVEAFKTGFMRKPIEHYHHLLRTGRLKVNEKHVDEKYILQEGDLISHMVYLRKEPPIYNRNVKVIFEDDDILVVDKPGSIPLFPGGIYRRNTLFSVLRDQQNYSELFTIQKIDRHTSGIAIISKKASYFAKQARWQMNQNITSKKFYARVQGQFPDTKQIVSTPINSLNKHHVQEDVDEEYEPKIVVPTGDQVAQPGDKNAITEYTLISYDKNSNSSLIDCNVTSGFNHYIRIQLQQIGFPILNDLSYGANFFGNRWLENQPGNYLPEDIRLKNYAKIVENHQKLVDMIELPVQQAPAYKKSFHTVKQILDEWDINRVFEIYLHAYEYTFSDKFAFPYFKTEDLPYWYDAENLVLKKDDSFGNKNKEIEIEQKMSPANQLLGKDSHEQIF